MYRLAANQNINPEFIKMCSGISEDLLGEDMKSNEKQIDEMCFRDSSGRGKSGKNSQWVQWISVKDIQLPINIRKCISDNPQKILALNKENECAVVWLDYQSNNIWIKSECSDYLHEFENITHWMTLPKPPEE